MAEKKERKNTPVGEALWAHVQQPHAYTPEGGQPKPPKYSVDVVFDPADPAWKAWANDIASKYNAIPVLVDKKTDEPVKRHPPIKKEFDKEDKPTGRHIVSFKTNDKFKPAVFDKHGKPFEGLVGNGSKVVVNYSENVFSNTAVGSGINFYLNGIQIKELVEYGKPSASAFGFDVEPEPESEMPPF